MAEQVKTDLFGAVCRDLERLTVDFFEEIADKGRKQSSPRYAVIDRISEQLDLQSGMCDDVTKTYSIQISSSHWIGEPGNGVRVAIKVHSSSSSYIGVATESIRSFGEVRVEDIDLLRVAAEALVAKVWKYVEGNRTHMADAVHGATNLIELDSYKGLSVLKEEPVAVEAGQIGAAKA